jgi:hypothetical protein
MGLAIKTTKVKSNKNGRKSTYDTPLRTVFIERISHYLRQIVLRFLFFIYILRLSFVNTMFKV